ncbi:hypothetical protein EIN_311990 [Entamoeba invadens IP1]|uniref:Origin recognition complex subunit n=1 Tax=Entamoeba invadens IP1 TaxID=370355 RepID=A0A0A1TUY2_ENTIV|nr:hypothetical protein EIN_311990 [Entamoeba invadens IP1]ELP83928.1 hypothetical protein EIN_311990 [Entamoeba invadens IP1]|eukprot:XP_004183274.1 hypothetical protein EIN_311990 [Entamoeba invadens IP1]
MEIVFERVNELNTAIFLNVKCLSQLQQKIRKLDKEEIGSISFVIGDEENELSQIMDVLSCSQQNDRSRPVSPEIHSSLEDSIELEFCDFEEENPEETVVFPSQLSSSQILPTQSSQSGNFSRLFALNPSHSFQSTIETFPPLPIYQKTTNKISYISINALTLFSPQDFFKTLTLKISTIFKSCGFKTPLRKFQSFKVFFNWAKNISGFRFVIIITHADVFLKKFLNLFYEVTDSFLTAFNNNHIAIIFLSLTDNFIDKKVNSRISFGKSLIGLHGPTTYIEYNRLFYQMTSFPTKTEWNRMLQEKYNTTLEDLFQMNCSVNALRQFSKKVLLLNRPYFEKKSEFRVLDSLQMFFQSGGSSLTPFDFVMLMGIFRLSQIELNEVMGIGELCSFLYQNVNGIEALQNIKESFLTVSDYHVKSLITLQRKGFITFNAEKSTVSLKVTQITLNSILETYSTFPTYSSLVKWASLLQLVFQK